MGKTKKIVPEFMLDNPNDSFMFLMPLSLKLDKEDIGNSYFEVAVKNLTKNEHFTSLIAPEVFFTHFKLHRAYKVGKLDNKINKKLPTFTRTYPIDTKLPKEQYDINLNECLNKDFIGQLLGYKHKYLEQAKQTFCCVIKFGQGIDLIIPHSVIAIYYYYRSTLLREATLRCNLEDLYYGYNCNPNDASIIVPKYVSENDTPFIHRFLCQEDASTNFSRIGKNINARLRIFKDKNIELDKVPIKAVFPVEDKFSIKYRGQEFDKDGRLYIYVHEILDDDSEIGFTKFTILYQGKKFVTEVDDLDKVPTIPTKEPSNTTECLKSNHANKNYRQNTVTSNRKNKCSSLNNVTLSTDNLTDEETLEKLKIMEETLTDENVDQSLTDASGNGEKKIRKTRVSSKGKELQKMSTTEYTHNFDEFNEYIAYMRTQEVIENLVVYENQHMETIYNGGNGNANPKCMIYGRKRQYITATFKYKDSYVGLLELENSSATSTWVVSSKNIVNNKTFQKFLKHFIDENLSINDIREKYKKSDTVKFKTKNHERSTELTQVELSRWTVGVLGKIIL